MCLPIFGQEAKYQFSQELFASDKYIRTRYERFPGEIVMLDSDTYKFGEKTIKISLEDKRYEVIFRKGIFNPDVVFGTESTRKDQEELKQLTQNERIFYNMIRNDRLSICCIQELKKLNPNPQTRRFVYWIFREEVANPTECYFELYNEKAAPNSSIEEFLESAEMTFFYQGTLIL